MRKDFLNGVQPKVVVCMYTLLSFISFILKFLHCSIWDEEHFSEQHHGKYWCVCLSG